MVGKKHFNVSNYIRNIAIGESYVHYFKFFLKSDCWLNSLRWLTRLDKCVPRSPLIINKQMSIPQQSELNKNPLSHSILLCSFCQEARLQPDKGQCLSWTRTQASILGGNYLAMSHQCTLCLEQQKENSFIHNFLSILDIGIRYQFIYFLKDLFTYFMQSNSHMVMLIAITDNTINKRIVYCSSTRFYVFYISSTV